MQETLTDTYFIILSPRKIKSGDIQPWSRTKQEKQLGKGKTNITKKLEYFFCEDIC